MTPPTQALVDCPPPPPPPALNLGHSWFDGEWKDSKRQYGIRSPSLPSVRVGDQGGRTTQPFTFLRYICYFFYRFGITASRTAMVCAFLQHYLLLVEKSTEIERGITHLVFSSLAPFLPLFYPFLTSISFPRFSRIPLPSPLFQRLRHP
jgi:hypothetical protein